MPVIKPDPANILKFWRAIETFDLPDVPLARRDDRKYFTELWPGDPLPWSGNLLAAEGTRWKHTLYFYCIPKQSVIDLFSELWPFASYRSAETQTGNTCLSALVLDHNGFPSEKAYTRASFAYGLKMLREDRDPEELVELLKKVQQEYSVRFQTSPEANEEGPRNPSVTWTEMERELDDLGTLINGKLPPELPLLCVSEEILHVQAPPDAPFLNSFYLNDLNYLISHPKNWGVPLSTYLTGAVDKTIRQDLLRNDTMFTCINPVYQSPGRWPSNPGHGLYSAQQAALHITLPSLKNNSGLMGINGPPGTGKTTLLREVVVDTVVTRARRLLSADINKIFSNARNRLTEYAGYYKPDGVLFGNGILVASNNNIAVENISKELPLLKNIDAGTFENAGYFSQTAQSLYPIQEVWGLLSAVLGNAKNRGNFSTSFWFNKGKGFDAYLKAQQDIPAKQKEEHYEQTAAELRSLLKEFEVFHKLASGHHKLLGKLLFKGDRTRSLVKNYEQLTAALQEEYGIAPDNLPDLSWLALPIAKIHQSTPYNSPAINTLRSRIFLKSLELHELAIRVNARFFRSNLSMFIDTLSGKYPPGIDEAVMEVLWNTFFFCIPLISTSLASIERLFSKTGRGSIGWLLLDEAGQATPQSACGAIWRSKRCVIIGDTLQVPPIVTIPAGLQKMLQDKYKLQDTCWLPSDHSAQFLGDRVTPIGTYVKTAGDEVWTGIPLRAHRRCNEPMFSISNRIAYDGQMVKVTPDEQDNIPLKSCWIDVQGLRTETGNVLLEEVEMLSRMIMDLASAGFGEGIYVISPFRSVADYCSQKIKHTPGLKFGTIHTFQGRESDIVFLILGTDRKNNGARQWASALPNMLNVAITRARKRIYVIGNRELWSSCKYFDQLAEMLPVTRYQSSQLF